MITGLHYDFSTEELSEHFDKQINYHLAKTEEYGKKLDLLSETGVIEDLEEIFGTGATKMSVGVDKPQEAVQKAVHGHEQKAAVHQIRKDHLIAGENYRLTEQEMEQIHLIESRW